MTEPAFEVAEVEVGVWRGVGIAKDAALRPTVPHSVTSPLRGFGLIDGNGLAATTVDVRWGGPAASWSRMDVRSSSAFWNHRLALALASSAGITSRMVGQAGAWGEAGLCCGGRGGQGRRSGAGGGLRGMLSSRSSSEEGVCSSNSRGTKEASRGCTRLAQPSKRVSPPATLPSRQVTRASSRPIMRWRALHAGAVRSSAGRWATLCAEEAPESNWVPSGATSGSEVAGPRNIPVVAKAREAASGRGVPWSAARVQVDRRREEFGSGEILANHEDHVGGSNEDRAEHLDLAEHGGPGGARGVQADCREAVEVCEHQGLAEDTGEEDGRHGPGGRTEVDELLRMRSERRRRGAPDLGMRSERRRRGCLIWPSRGVRAPGVGRGHRWRGRPPWSQWPYGGRRVVPDAE